MYNFEQDAEAMLSKNWVSKPASQQESEVPNTMFGKIETPKEDFFEFPKQWLPKKK